MSSHNYDYLPLLGRHKYLFAKPARLQTWQFGLAALVVIDVIVIVACLVHTRPSTSLDNSQKLNNVSIVDKLTVSTFLSHSSTLMTRDERAVVSSLYTDSYAAAVVTLGHTITAANVSARMILIYIPGRLSSRTICLASAAGWTFHPVPFIRPPHDGKGITPRFIDQYTKLNIWTLDTLGIKSLVYLDADTLVLKNFDELFALPFNFAASPDVFMNIPNFTIEFNAGVLFIRPSTAVFSDMLSKLETADYPLEFAEQAFLNVYFGAQALRLPYSYNGNIVIKKKNRQLWETLLEDMHIMHYTLSKPFPPEWLGPEDMEVFFSERKQFSNGFWAKEMGVWKDSYRDTTRELQAPLSQCI